MTGLFIQRDGTCTSAATDKPDPCCYTDANGSSCHCQRRKDAEAENTRLSALVAELERERDRALMWATDQHAQADSYALRLGRAEAALATARADALREAAAMITRIADGYHKGGDEAIACGLYLTAGNILALTPQEPKP